MESTCSSIVPQHSSSTDAVYSRLASSVVEVVEQTVREDASFEARERAIAEALNEVGRRALQSELQRIADSHTDEVRVRGERYRRHEPGKVTYHTIVGDVRVDRFSYRRVGVHNGPTIVPLDLATGIFEGSTPTLLRSVAEGIAEMPSRRYEEVMQAACRPVPSRSTLERPATAAGSQLKEDILTLEAFVRAEEALPDGAHAISIGLDRTTVPMAEDREPSAPPKPRRRKEPYVRRPPPPMDVNYRMPYVGTVSVVDKNGEALTTRKYAATVEEGPAELVLRVMADVRRLRSLDDRLEIVVVQDGALELWGLMWDALRAEGIPRKKWNLVLDRFHVTERISAVLGELVRDEAERKRQLDHWRRRLDESDRAVSSFCRWIDKRVPYSSPRRKRIEAHHGYLFINSLGRYTRYKTFKEKGFPTGSGVTEGACKSLVTMRCKRSGQRWRQDGLSAILTLRAVIQSQRMPTLWPHFARRLRREIECA